MKDQILNWLASGRVGLSSRAMAFAVLGLPTDKNHPSDPGDLNRCLLLLKAVPEIRDNMEKVAGISMTWVKLVARWDELEQCFLDEVGLDGCKGDKAPKTYKLMKDIGC